MSEETKPCGACGTPTPYKSRAHLNVPACLRHRGVWWTPAPDYTCPTACVEQNHPGREHHDWLASESRTPKGAGDE